MVSGAASERPLQWRPAALPPAGARRPLVGAAVACSALVHAAAFVAFSPFAERGARSMLAPAGPSVVTVALAPLPPSTPVTPATLPNPPTVPRRGAASTAGASQDHRAASGRLQRVDDSPGIPVLDSTPSLGLPISTESPVMTASVLSGSSASPVASQGLSAATYLLTPEPVYPAASREEGEEGFVLLRVRVSRMGLPEEILVEKSSGHRSLDRAAIEGVKRWTFAPARRGDEAIEAWMQVPIRFLLG